MHNEHVWVEWRASDGKLICKIEPFYGILEYKKGDIIERITLDELKARLIERLTIAGIDYSERISNV